MVATATLAEKNRRGYRNDRTGSTHCCLMVSTCSSFNRTSSLCILCLGDNLASDQPVSAISLSTGHAGGWESRRITRQNHRSSWTRIDCSQVTFTFLPAGRPLGYRHINRFPACERVDSLQPSHFPYTATSVRSNPSGCVARCGARSQRYQFPSGNGYFVHASLCSKFYPWNI